MFHSGFWIFYSLYSGSFILKKNLRIWLVRCIVFLLSLPAGYFLAVLGLSSIPVNSGISMKSSDQDVLIYVKSNGAHTDLVLPVVNEIHDWRYLVNMDGYRGLTYPYAAFGWGDKGFYLNTPTWADLRMSTAFNAVSGRGGTAMRVTLYASVREDAQTWPVRIAPERYRELVAYVEASFQRSEDGGGRRIGTIAYIPGDDQFYEARGIYSCFYTCNSWTNEGLKTAGIKTALWAPLEWCVRRYR